ncbi:MAG: hypothetical protein HUJ61_02260 [Bacilli bacterium]|nr:hypothetical protein [Bacilli bacterium]
MLKKIYSIIKSILFVGIGISILVIGKKFVEGNYLHLLVGGVMLFFSLEYFVSLFVLGLDLTSRSSFKAIFEFILGLVVMALLNKPQHFNSVCIIWGTWSILREDDELVECFEMFKKGVPVVINFLESLLVILFSVLMIINPIEHEAIFHTYILGLELILEIVFPIVDDLLEKVIENKKLKAEQAIEDLDVCPFKDESTFEEDVKDLKDNKKKAAPSSTKKKPTKKEV